MSDWELLDYDPTTGVRKWIAADQHEEDAVLIKTDFNPLHTKAILDANKAAQNEGFDRRSEMWHAASIPAVVQYEWWHRYRINTWSPNEDDQKRMKALLNSSEWAYLKRAPITL